MKKLLFVVFVLMIGMPFSVLSQNRNDYSEILKTRAEKIVKTLGINDSVKYKRVCGIIANQYSDLGKINDKADAMIKELNASALSSEERGKQINIEGNERDAALYALHCKFISALLAELTLDQVEAVKDGMTYNILNVTYAAQLDMIPALKDDEKRQIRAWLLEAREHAMDASSSEMKHAWFGKYKGRINNYLSVRGYNLDNERKAWQERLKK